MTVYTFCPYCDSRILPGQAVVGVKDEDPARMLWHTRCREMWEYDEKLAESMRNQRPTLVGMPAPEHLPADIAEAEVVDDPDARRR